MNGEIVRRVQAKPNVLGEGLGRRFELVDVANEWVERTHPVDLIPRGSLHRWIEGIQLIQQILRQWRSRIWCIDIPSPNQMNTARHVIRCTESPAFFQVLLDRNRTVD